MQLLTALLNKTFSFLEYRNDYKPVHCTKTNKMKRKTRKKFSLLSPICHKYLAPPSPSSVKNHQSNYMNTLPRKIYAKLNTKGHNYYLQNRECDKINSLKRLMHIE